MRFLTSLPVATGAAALGVSAGSALGQGLPIIGQPVSGGMGFQPAVTELSRDIVWLDSFVLIIITAITVFVTALLLWCAYRFAAKRNAVPSTFTHNSPLEIAWTLGPIVILVAIGAFSLPVLFKQQEIPVADVTIKATGAQWFWTYNYVDEGLEFPSYMIGSPYTNGENVLTPEVEAMLTRTGYSRDQWLLATDTTMVVPVNKTIVLQVTGQDVIHAWHMPAFGVMQSAVPGRLSQLWFKAEQEGVFFGQCTALCGPLHAYMPITVKVVSEDVYEKWLAANIASLETNGLLDIDTFVQPEALMVAGTAATSATQVAASE